MKRRRLDKRIIVHEYRQSVITFPTTSLYTIICIYTIRVDRILNMMRRNVVCAAVLLTVLLGLCKNAQSQELHGRDQTDSGRVARGGNERIEAGASPLDVPQHSVAKRTAAIRYSNCTKSLDVFNCTDSNVIIYRTFDGTCNNHDCPLNGAANRPMKQLLPPVYEDDASLPVGYEQATSGQPFSPPCRAPS